MPRGRPGTRACVLAFTVLLCMLIGACSSDDEIANEAGRSVPKPDTDLARSTIAYLDNDGRALRVMHQVAAELVQSEERTSNKCREAGVVLDETATPDRAFQLIRGVPDPVLRSALYEERSALGVALTACLAEMGYESPRLVKLVGVVRERLIELSDTA